MGPLRLLRIMSDLIELELTGIKKEGLQQNVSVFLTAAGAADMGLRETADSFGHGCPASIGQHAAVRTRLRHTKRHGGAGECATHTLAANARVNVFP